MFAATERAIARVRAGQSARASAIDPGISIATVYRTVRLFEEAGILAKHDFGDGRARYEETPEEHHDHLIDVRSGKVIEFVDREIEELQEAFDSLNNAVEKKNHETLIEV